MVEQELLLLVMLAVAAVVLQLLEEMHRVVTALVLVVTEVQI